jgi:tRNA pseudouridine38-40 synthase
MTKYKIIVAYDGTDYFGWQVQTDKVTIAGTLQDSFKSVFGKDISIAGASRTDAGVHALGQTATFSVDLPITAQQLLFAWHNVLPESIVIPEIQEVPLDWNPRHNVRQKTYKYHFFAERPLPFIARYGWHYRHPVDLEKLKACFAIFIGTQDFRSFCTGDEYENTVRTIDDIFLEYNQAWQAYAIVVKGPGFLRYMIRRIVGACLEAASHDTVTINDLQKALEQKNPLQLLPTAPAQGLLLYQIDYFKEETHHEKKNY